MPRNLLGHQPNADDPSRGYVAGGQAPKLVGGPGALGAVMNPDEVEPAIELTVVMPCLNEAETIAVCIEKALGFMERSGIAGEVVIADNGSTDGSQKIATDLGARVVDIPIRGYGAALQGGIAAARGEYVIMGDSDDSYDFSRLDAFVERLRAGDELVMGNRFRGGIAPGAMPNLHRYLGNPFLTLLGRVLFRAPIRDSQCGLRGFSREAMNTVGLRTTGMEFASEMVVKSTLHGLKIAEVPTTLSPDGRSRPPHLRSWRDGSRILRFHLLHSPRWLFYLPGMFLAGLSAALFLSADGDASAGLSTRMFASVLIMIAAVQSIVTGLLATRFGIQYGVLPGHANGGGRRETVHGAKSLWVLERAAPIGITLLIVGGLVLGLSGGDGPRSAMALLSGGVALLTGFHLILAALVDCLFALGRD